MERVGRAKTVAGGEHRGELGRRPVGRAQVQAREQGAERGHRLRLAVPQWLGQHLRQQQHRANPRPAQGTGRPARRCRREQRPDPSPQRMAWDGSVDDDIGVEGVHRPAYRASRSARIAAISSSAYSLVIFPPVVSSPGLGSGLSAAADSKP